MSLAYDAATGRLLLENVAAQAGQHLLLEKPIAASETAANALAEPVRLGCRRPVRRADGMTEPVAQLRTALTELSANARSGRTAHPCDVRFGQAVGRVIAEAERQIG
jgi:hypothetical protein